MTNHPFFAALDVSLEKTAICGMSLHGIILREVGRKVFRGSWPADRENKEFP